MSFSIAKLASVAVKQVQAEDKPTKCYEMKEAMTCIGGGSMAPSINTVYNKICHCEGDPAPTKSFWLKCSSSGWRATGKACEK